MDKVWKNSFSLLLEQGQRSAEKATCIDSWRTLLVKPSFEWKSKSYDWLEEWITFLEKNNSIKGISRDLWNHILKFARETIADESLRFHTDEASWPALIDEFAEHIKEVRGLNKRDEDVDMED
jgi:DCN1-like protein 1/2